jgi:Tol biopolymer transport system component
VRAAWPLIAITTALLLASCGGSDKADPDLIFVSSRDGEYAIYGMSATGSSERRLTDAEIDPSTPKGLLFQTEPAWSPDGGTIVFVSKRSGASNLYAMNADGSETRRLTSTKDDDAQPDWSPDGKQIVFARGTSPRLFVMGADGAAAHRVTDELADETEPAWSPDGRWIAYSRRDPGSSIRELWLVRPDGSQRRRLTKINGIAQAPSWSPDGRHIVFSANVRNDGYDIYTVAADGKDVKQVTSGEDAFEPAWSPDGKTIAFSEAGAIVSIDVGDGQEETLTDPANNDSSPAWNPQQGEGE